MTDSLKENLQKADEWLNNLKNTLPHIKDEYKEYATDRIKLLEWLIEHVKQLQQVQSKAERYKQALVEISNADWNLEGLDAERELDKVTDVAFKALEVKESE